MKSYLDLEIYQLAFRLATKVHKHSNTLPKIEQYELGSQVRRSAQSIRANIVEGYGRRRYKNEFIRFLVFADASLLETEDHLKMINELYPDQKSNELFEDYQKLGKKLNSFIAFVEKSWNTKPKTDNR